MKLLNFIICEDIRQETGNKFSLMGVFTDAITFRSTPDKIKQWPKAIKFCIFAQMEFEQGESKLNIDSFNIEIQLNERKKELGGSKLPPVSMRDSKGFVFNAIFDKFSFSEKGKLSFNINFYDTDKKLIAKVPSNKSLTIEEIILK